MASDLTNATLTSVTLTSAVSNVPRVTLPTTQVAPLPVFISAPATQAPPPANPDMGGQPSSNATLMQDNPADFMAAQVAIQAALQEASVQKTDMANAAREAAQRPNPYTADTLPSQTPLAII